MAKLAVATSYLSICASKEGAFALNDNLVLYTPDVCNTMSLFIGETGKDVLITPQEDAHDDLLSGVVAMTEKYAKFRFAKEALLSLTGDETELIIELITLVKKHHIESNKLIALVGSLKEKGKGPKQTLEKLNEMTDKQVKTLVEINEEMPSLLIETYTEIFKSY